MPKYRIIYNGYGYIPQERKRFLFWHYWSEIASGFIYQTMEGAQKRIKRRKNFLKNKGTKVIWEGD